MTGQAGEGLGHKRKKEALWGNGTQGEDEEERLRRRTANRKLK